MATINHIGNLKTFSSKTFPSNFVKESTYNPRDSKPSTLILKSPTKTSSKKCFKCLGFRHIATNCPTKRTMMVKGWQVVNEHSDQSSMSNSPSSSKKTLVIMNVRYIVKVTYS